MKCKLYAIAVVLSLILMAGCSLWETGPSTQTGFGKLDLTLDLSKSKGLLYTVTRCSVSLTKSGETPISQDLFIDQENEVATHTFDKLKTGIWNITVTLYDSSGEIANGSSSVNILGGKSTVANIIVSFLYGQLQLIVDLNPASPLTILAYNDRNNPSEAAKWDSLLQAFKGIYPDLDVQVEFGYDQPYGYLLQAKLQAGTLNDVVYLQSVKNTPWPINAGKIADLRSMIAGHESEFLPEVLRPQGKNGEIWWLPEQLFDCHVVYVNTQLLNQLGLTYPATLAGLLAQSQQIRDAGFIPISMSDKDGWPVQSCLLGALVERTGGKTWFDKAISGVGGSFTDPEFINALTVVQSLAQANMFSPGILDNNYETACYDFASGKAAYLIDGDWQVGRLQSVLGDRNNNERPDLYNPALLSAIEMRTFPDLPSAMINGGTSGSTVSVAAGGYGMNSDLSGIKADAAWAWIWFWSGPVGSTIRRGFWGWNASYIMPPRQDCGILDKMGMTFRANTPSGYVIDNVMDGGGMNVLQSGIQEMIRGNKSPQTVAAEYEAWVAANDSGRPR